jgi:uncharacterized membrane protein
MFVYHFAFDLRFYRVIAADFEHDPFWLAFRALIVTSFLLLVGVSLVLADRSGEPPSHFWKRVGIIAGVAPLAASVRSWILFPQTFITFGILHCILVASVVAWPLVRRPALALALGLAVILAAFAWSHPQFDARAWSWVGFTTHKAATEDYVPAPVGRCRLHRYPPPAVPSPTWRSVPLRHLPALRAGLPSSAATASSST